MFLLSDGVSAKESKSTTNRSNQYEHTALKFSINKEERVARFNNVAGIIRKMKKLQNMI